ncbi:hypothetical protein ACFL0S_03235 [Thermodesulfobacteriota bacterium]
MRKKKSLHAQITNHVSLDRLLILFYSFLSLIVTIGICHLKLEALFSYQYAIDVFIYDQMMQEILIGNIGLEYSYGNQFGDHSLLWIFLLTPLKMILAEHMITLLILITPLTYCLSSLIIFFVLRVRVGAIQSFCLSLVYLFSYPIFRGLYEPHYGFHFDTASGFVATVFVCFLLANQQANEAGKRTFKFLIAFWITFVLFLSMKEEMALLGIIFFLALLSFKQNRLYLMGLAVALASFICEMFLIYFSTTPWNRTNTDIIHRFFDSDLTQLFQSQGMILIGFIIIIFCIMFFSMFLDRKTRNPYAFGLFLMGLIKICFGLAMLDFRPFFWHQFPGIVMLTGAIVVQMAEIHCPRSSYPNWLRWGMTCGLLIVSLTNLILFEIPYVIKKQVIHVKSNAGIQPSLVKERRQNSLTMIKAKIDRDRVVAINGFTAIDWVDGFRYSFFPRGVFLSPRGIADYIVVDNFFHDKRMPIYFNKQGISEFEQVVSTPFHTLWHRKAIEEDAAYDRGLFIEKFGADSIGGSTKFAHISNSQ